MNKLPLQGVGGLAGKGGFFLRVKKCIFVFCYVYIGLWLLIL